MNGNQQILQACDELLNAVERSRTIDQIFICVNLRPIFEGDESMIRFLGGLFLLLLLIVACGGADLPQSANQANNEPLTAQDMTVGALTTAIAASAEPPYDPTLLRAELETAVSLWQSQAIERYQVTVRHQRGTWNTQNFTITVENGTVIDSKHSCFPEKDCTLQEVDPATLTVEALFKTAEAVIALNDPETQLTFNPTYGYPNSLIYEEASWVLDSFNLLNDE